MNRTSRSHPPDLRSLGVRPVRLDLSALAGRPHRNLLPGFGLAPQPGQQGTKGGGSKHHDLWHQGGLRRTDLRDNDLVEPGSCCGRHGGKNPADWAQLPVQPQFTQKSNPLDSGGRNGAGRGQDRDGDA
jgi:hypothetical protein